MEQALEYLIDHWTFLVAALVINALVSAIKRAFGLMEYNGTIRWFILHTGPLVLGIALGFVPDLPVPEGMDSLASRILYFAGAGVTSSWTYRFAVEYARRKGYNIGTSPIPPKPE